MPVNQQDISQVEVWKGNKKEKKVVLDVMARIKELQNHRSQLKANPYDKSKKARSIEKTWDFCDFAALPHKYSHPEMQDWMANESIPLIFSKTDTSLAILISKNPEIEISAKNDKYEKKALIREKLYDASWDKGDGRQQLVKFVYNICKYGTGIGREYHRFEERTIDEITEYNPDGEHKTEKRKKTIHDEPYFEVLPIRDCWIDNRARPYDWTSIRDWAWQVEYDTSTADRIFDKYPNIKYVAEQKKQRTDKGETDVSGHVKRLYFYEDCEDNEFIITDGTVLVHKGTLPDNELSLVIGMWRLRNEWTIYGLSLPEILEGVQNNLDRTFNMAVNQTVLAVGGAGYYSGTGDPKKSDMMLEPKLKKLKEADKIVFPKIPPPDAATFTMVDYLTNHGDMISGITKSLGGEQVGKTLGEAVLNREAGLNRLSLPLQNIEFALERHAELRMNNIKRIYSRPRKSTLVTDNLGNIIDKKLYDEYLEERKNGETTELTQKFPVDEEGKIYRNEYRTERMPIEKNEKGEAMMSEKDKWIEILPDDNEGEFEYNIRAMSTIPMSQTLEEAKALETFNIVMQLPYTDLFKSEKEVLKARRQDPDNWMKTDEDVIKTQEEAQGGIPPEPNSFQRNLSGQPVNMKGMSQDITSSLT